MARMDQGVAAVIAAGAAGVVGVTGSLIGVWVGRRTVRDQAQVEHEQWLRNQRQEAYVALIAAWDELLPGLELGVMDGETMHDIEQADAWDEAGRSCLAGLETKRAPLRRAAERVEMLGPEAVEQVVAPLVETANTLVNCLVSQYGITLPGRESEPIERFMVTLDEVDERRDAFIAAAKEILRQTPDTKRP